MKIGIITLLKNSLRRIGREPEPIEPLVKIDESLTPNMRALRLVMSLAEQLLSMGVAASAASILILATRKLLSHKTEVSIANL